jgi:hypothetical protein
VSNLGTNVSILPTNGMQQIMSISHWPPANVGIKWRIIFI